MVQNGKAMDMRRFYWAVLGRILRASFPFWQRLGFHVTLSHYFQPIPDTRTLDSTLWTRHSELAGLRLDDGVQIEFLTLVSSSFKREYEGFPRARTSAAHEFYLSNPAFKAVDAEILYCMIRYFAPRRIFEVGSGFSTLVSARAVRKNMEQDRNYACQFECIDPYPPAFLRSGLGGLTRVVKTKIQDVPLSEFTKLEKNDILFIDSTHVLTIGNDVQYLYLEVLPRINQGVLIHVHDIFLPAEYPRDWILREHWFWNEQYLLQAFLAFNECFEVVWAGSYMHLKYPEKLEAAFNSYDRSRVWPGSFWFRRIR